MEPITAAKAATVAVQNKDKIGNVFLMVVIALLVPNILFICCFSKLISAFTPDGSVSSSSNFDVTQTAIYKSVKVATKSFYDDMWETMGKERTKQLKKYTSSVILKDKNGKDYEGEKCDAIVTRRMNYLGDAYLIAYLVYAKGVDVNTARINEKVATDFLKDISKVTINETGYREIEITNEFLALDRIAEKYFTNEATADEFKQSCYAYSQFFDISTAKVAKVDVEAGNYTNVDYSATKLMNIPLYLQYKGDWASAAYGNGTIKQNGCCPTCLAMVFSFLRQENIYPDDVTAWTGNKYYVNGQGTSWNIFNDVSDWGVRCINIGKSQEQLIQALKDKKPVIASMGPGKFTKGGHFIVLSGITADGKIRVNDPNDSALKNHINTNFEMSLIMRESKNMWVCEVAQ